MFHNFFEVRRNSDSIAAIFEEVMGHSSQRKIIGLDQSFLNKPAREWLNSSALCE